MNSQFIHNLFDRAAERFPDRIAIVGAHRSITYLELQRETNRRANFLLANGARKGSVVAILAADTVEAITSIIATLKAGCAFVPLDADIPEKRLAAMLAQAHPDWYLVESRLWDRLRAVGGESGQHANVVCLDGATLEAEATGTLVQVTGLSEYGNTEQPPHVSEPDDMCYVYFTSGSTGRPKGIAGRLKGIDHFIRWETETLKLDETIRVSQLLPLSFDGSLRDIFVPLCVGGTVCVPESRETILNARALVNWLDAERINVVHCVPSLFRSLINAGIEPEQLAELRYILMAGEALLGADVGKWMEVFGERVQLINLYGTSETTMAKFIYFVKPSDASRRAIPIGKPMEGAKAVVVNEKGAPCPAGVAGEIYIRTPFRSLGYVNEAELTAEVFIPNPFNTDPLDIVYKTGDLGRVLDDGNYEYLGRRDQQVKIRGVRVELAEVEGVLRQHGGVKDVVMMEREDGSGYNYLCAYVVLDGEVEIMELRDHVALHLPDYMVPSAFIALDEFPRTLSGKIDRRALPAPGQSRLGLESEFIAPGTPVEEKVAEIWRGLLGIQQLGVQDNFFRLGGHSLLATQLLSRVRDAFQVEIPLRVLFESPTVAGLAQKITERQNEAGELKPLAAISRVVQDDLEQQLANLDGLSDEEVELLLQEMAIESEVSQ